MSRAYLDDDIGGGYDTNLPIYDSLNKKGVKFTPPREVYRGELSAPKKDPAFYPPLVQAVPPRESEGFAPGPSKPLLVISDFSDLFRIIILIIAIVVAYKACGVLNRMEKLLDSSLLGK
jgi:hypothetical protein